MNMGESLKYKIESLRQQNDDAEAARKRADESYRRLIEDQRELICRFAPGGVLTFVNDAYCRYFGKTREELHADRTKGLPIPRRVAPEEVAEAAVWLASDAAAYVNGERFNFTGGMELA